MIFVSVAGVAYNDTTSPQSLGDREVDTLTGGVGQDTFQLWGGSARSGIHAYYDAAGNSDYALITDFNKGEDIIKLTKVAGTGSASSAVNYSLAASPNEVGTGIYIDKPHSQTELIAILQDVTPNSISLGGSYFSYFS